MRYEEKYVAEGKEAGISWLACCPQCYLWHRQVSACQAAPSQVANSCLYTQNPYGTPTRHTRLHDKLPHRKAQHSNAIFLFKIMSNLYLFLSSFPFVRSPAIQTLGIN